MKLKMIKKQNENNIPEEIEIFSSFLERFTHENWTRHHTETIWEVNCSFVLGLEVMEKNTIWAAGISWKSKGEK